MKKNYPAISFFAFIFLTAFSGEIAAQSIGLGTISPSNSALLDITSTSKGILIPRMTTTAITAISNPAKGLMVLDTMQNQLMINMGIPSSPNWKNIVFSSGWSLTGNGGTDPASQFIGSTDNQPLRFRVNNTWAGEMNPNLNTTFFGFRAGQSNNGGTGNTATGESAFQNNTIGSYNTANGYAALFSNTGGSYNTAFGEGSLGGTTNSQYNTAIGFNAGAQWDLGYNNTFLGANTQANGPDFFNVIAIGQGVLCTSSSQARIGNSSTVTIGGFVPWTNFSDGRYKKEIKEDVKGLDFILKLRPVTYKLDIMGIRAKLHEGQGREMDARTKQSITEKESTVFTGFVAQEVEQAANDVGFNFSGIDKPKNENDYYGLRYSDFVVPLVKAVQEQQVMIDKLNKIIDAQNKQINLLNNRVNALEKK